MTDTNVNNGLETKKVIVVGFSPRLLAALMDGAMVGFLSFMLAFVIGLVAVFTSLIHLEGTSGVLELLMLLCLVFFSIIYYIGFWTNAGQTMGNTVVGIKVVRADGSRVSLGRALLRYIGYIINASLFSIGFLWAAFDPKRQGWHDKLADTLVVYAETEFTSTEEVDLVPSDVDRKGWIWGALWAVTALFLPVGALAGLLTVGPYITITVVTLIRNIF